MYLTFAWRYFKAKKSTSAINIIAWVSVLAITVGTASLIILLSVFNGFEDLVKSLYADFYTDLKVVPAEGKTVRFSDAQLKHLAEMPQIKAFSMVVEEKALLQNGELKANVSMKGVDTRYGKVAGLPDRIVKGAFNLGTPDKPAMVLGTGVESAMGTQADRAIEPLTVYLPKRGVSIDANDPLQSLSASNVNTSGTFAIQQDFDNKYVITNLAFLKRMLNLQWDEYGGIEIRLNNPGRDYFVKRLLDVYFGNGYVVQTRYEQNRSLYSVMNLEKWVIYAILSLILVVAAFTMIGALTMLVLEKQKDIQILKALGTSNYLIQKIFLSEGILLGAVGGGMGILLAIIACKLQVTYKLVKLQGSSFLIDYYPVKLIATDFLLVLGTVITVAWIASWLPARKASLQPIELRS
ncbi:MAG: ABC transporter permease [Williamsia sp.]|nr:ABC transporter permease [Williamsia sp.]